MHSLISAVGIVLFTVGTVFGATHGGASARTPAPGDGGVSAFYVWDKEIPRKPGKMLRQEPLPANLMLANASEGVRVLYTSTDGIDGKTPVTVSGAIFIPKGQAPAGGWPIVAWSHGSTGIADVCAPSWNPRSPRDTEHLNAWLALGFSIVATDYEGLGAPGPHPRHVARALGWSVLDSVRAALDAFPTLTNSVVIVGQSQGAGAALSAALLAGKYAPNVKILGTVATGISIYAPFSPPTKAAQISAPARTGGGLNAVATIMDLYELMVLDPAFRPLEYLADAAKPVFEQARTACLADLIRSADESHVTEENLFRKKPAGMAARASSYDRYPTPHFTQPVFIGTGLADVTAIPEGQYNFAMAACGEGSTVEMHYYPGKDHPGTVNASLADSIPFVKKLLAGQRVDGNCRGIKPPSSAN